MILCICTINLNNSAGVERTAASLKSVMSNPQIGCVFIDGLSKDNSLEIARKYWPVEQILAERDDGIYEAMNKALRYSAKYYLWLNSGDELADVDAEALLTLLSKGHDCIQFSVEEVSPDTSTSLWSASAKFSKTSIPSFHHAGLIVASDVIRRLSGYDQTYRMCADFKLACQISNMNGINYHSVPTVLSRFYRDGISSKNSLIYENFRVLWETKRSLLIPYFYHWFRMRYPVRMLMKNTLGNL
ncbi:MAG: glycosyltransferase [Pseudomonadota bacterium]